MLFLRECTHQEASFAVCEWHYTRSMPVATVARFGVWESGVFIGCILFGLGTRNIAKAYGVIDKNACELTRVALTHHVTPVSKIVSVALLLLKQKYDNMEMIVSYADPLQNHHGGIYQAMNWTYVGKTTNDKRYIDNNGKKWHSRSVSESGQKKHFGVYKPAPKPSECQSITIPGKYKYVYPLNSELRHTLLLIKKPYPIRATSINGNAASIQDVEGGSIPTVALHSTLDTSQGQ